MILPTLKVRRIAYRAVYQEFHDDPLPSRSEQGRFHGPDTGRATTYLAASAATSWAEVTHRWQADPDAYRMAEVEVALKRVADLTDSTMQKRYSVDLKALVGDDYRPCQRLADRLRADGYEGIWTYSRADQPDGRQLVVFLDRLSERSRVAVRDLRKIDQPPR